jgi:hypothetical protein
MQEMIKTTEKVFLNTLSNFLYTTTHPSPTITHYSVDGALIASLHTTKKIPLYFINPE